MRRVSVGRQSAGFIRRGHPWLRPDRFTRGLDDCGSGEPVLLVDERGRPLAAALADPAARIAARVYSHDAEQSAFDPASATRAALDRRAPLLAEHDTDCYRLIHGEADGLPGLRVERYGPVLVVLARARCIAPHLAAVIAELRRSLPDCRLVLREHYDDLRRRDVRTRALDDEALDSEQQVIGRELGCRYRLRPFAGLATGIYVDQRGTRRWLRERCAGLRVGNLFSYTGAFSIATLDAGAAAALDIDLAKPALRSAAENAELNGVVDRHRCRRGDCRRVLEQCDEHFDIIVCDPPTAAQGGRGGWLARRDYPPLLELCWRRLQAGGLLLASSNSLGKPFPLRETISRIAPGARELDAPELEPDLPQIPGFPEGRPFHLAIYRRDD